MNPQIIFMEKQQLKKKIIFLWYKNKSISNPRSDNSLKGTIVNHTWDST